MVKKQAGWVKTSGWLFVLGIIISIIAGLVYPLYNAEVMGVLSVIGFIIGLLGIAGVSTIEKSDINLFLLAVIALMAAGGAGAAFGGLPQPLGKYLMAIVNNIGVLVVPAAVLIALKSIWHAGSTKF